MCAKTESYVVHSFENLTSLFQFSWYFGGVAKRGPGDAIWSYHSPKNLSAFSDS